NDDAFNIHAACLLWFIVGCPECFFCFPFIGYGMVATVSPRLDTSYSPEYISRRYLLGRTQERQRHYGLVQHHVFMQRLRPFSCTETFRHGDRWPRPAETNRGGVLA